MIVQAALKIWRLSSSGKGLFSHRRRQLRQHPGVKGIGAVGAKKLLAEYGSLEGIYENLALVRNERTKNMLAAARDEAFLSKKLATLFDDAITSLDLEHSKFPEQNPLINISEILKEYDLNRLLKSLQKEENAEFKLGFRANLLLDEASIEKAALKRHARDHRRL